jgi:hypothetical protein
VGGRVWGKKKKINKIKEIEDITTYSSSSRYIKNSKIPKFQEKN